LYQRITVVRVFQTATVFHLINNMGHQWHLVLMMGGVALLVAGGVFFLISVGLPQYMWVVLGSGCLGSGALLLAMGVGCWLLALGQVTRLHSSKAVQREEAETFTVSDDQLMLT
jgi:hypothetical protein